MLCIFVVVIDISIFSEVCRSGQLQVADVPQIGHY